MKKILLLSTSLLLSYLVNAQLSNSGNPSQSFEIKSNIYRIEIKNKIGDKIPDPIVTNGNYGILINTKENAISFISENVVRSTGKIINVEKINGITIYLYLDTRDEKCTLVLSDSYYYCLSDNMTQRFTIKK